MLHAVIMAGGSGTRFWPESRADLPKQLMRMSGDRTMIQATVDRLGDLVSPDRVFIATTERLRKKIHEQLTQLDSLRHASPHASPSVYRPRNLTCDGSALVGELESVNGPRSASRLKRR